MEGNAVTTTRGSQILYISVMWIVAGAAAGLHVAESLYCLHLGQAQHEADSRPALDRQHPPGGDLR